MSLFRHMALGAFLFPMPALAAEPPVKAADEIIVTATRTGETKLQDTPIAITVLSGEELNVRGIEEFDDLVRYTPGLSISENTNFAQVYIRGIGTNNVFVGSDPSAPIHLDGVYLARPLASVFDMMNVDRVEVLKGPQGTLYGRNATAGTVNIITELPDQRTDNWVSVDIGKFDKRRFKLHASGPLIDNKLAGNFEILRHDRDGYVDNIHPTGPDPLSDEHRTGYAGTLRWFLGDDAEFILKGDLFEMDEMGVSFKPTYRTATKGTPRPGTPPATVIGDFHTLSVPTKPEMETSSYGFSAKYIRDLSDQLTFTSLTAHRRLDAYLRADVDWTDAGDPCVPVVVGTTCNPISDIRENQEQYSQEFQLNGVTDNLTWVTGLYYFNEFHDSLFRPNAPTNVIDSVSKAESWAVFGNGTWQLDEKTSGTLGARFNYDRKDFNNDASLAGGFVTYNVSEEQSWRSFLPRFALDYQLDDNRLLYGSISRGYKSGGYNPSTNPAGGDPGFDPEWVWSYEVGMKSRSADRALRVNTSLFYYDYTDIQVQNFLGAGVLAITNAGDAEVFGSEIEAVWSPNLNWELELGLAYLHAQYLDGATVTRAPGGAANVTPVDGNTLNVSPEWTANIGVNYYQFVDEGSVHYRLNYYRQTQEYYSAFNDDENSQPAYDVTSARVSFLTQDEEWEVSFYGDNLTNTDYASAGTDFNVQGVTRSINPPRTYGLQVIWRGL